MHLSHKKCKYYKLNDDKYECNDWMIHMSADLHIRNNAQGYIITHKYKDGRERRTF